MNRRIRMESLVAAPAADFAHLDVPFEYEVERYELREPPRYRFAADRREFVQALGAGLMVAVTVRAAEGQQGRGRRRRGGRDERREEQFSERFHIGVDGIVTVMTSKVEVGQGSRTQIAQAAAEELRLPLENVKLLMADTKLCPDDGGTAGSRTTPSTVPAVRRAAAAARELLQQAAATRLAADASGVSFDSGTFSDQESGRTVTLAELAADPSLPQQLDAASRPEIDLTAVEKWNVLGTSVPKLAGREVVTGAHRYPSDIVRPDLLYGKVLRPPAYGAKLLEIDLSAAEAIEGVSAVRDGDFVGCTAPNSYLAGKAVEAIAESAKWDSAPATASSENIFEHLKSTGTSEGSGWPSPRSDDWGDGPGAIDQAAKKFQARYTAAYIQHAPMEPRAAVAEWSDDTLTVWTGTQQPGRVHGELRQTFRLPADAVRVIVPDTGGGFGGKHSGEAAVEAARLAKAAGRPVQLRWTREEEFTWAYFRPAALIEISAGLDDADELHAWDMTNYNSGGSALGTPYRIAHGRTQFQAADSPLRQGSYRALASTANNFARESAMDELAELAGADPLEFRLSHLQEGRLKDVLRAAAEKFRWSDRYAAGKSHDGKQRGVGLACGTEKGSYVAACAEVELQDGRLRIVEICEAFECGAIQNPDNLHAQVEGCMVMGLGGALTEQIDFAEGKVLNPRFSEYRAPRMEDLPLLDIVLVDRPDLPSVGAGETPIIAVAPALANAIARAGAGRVRGLPLLPAAGLKA